MKAMEMTKPQTHKRQFESLKMKDEENVVAYLLRVEEIVNTIRGIGEKVEEMMIVQKVLGLLPLIFDANFSPLKKWRILIH